MNRTSSRLFTRKSLKSRKNERNSFSSAENFYIKIVLNSCTKTLNDLNSKKCEINDPIDFVFRSLLNRQTTIYDEVISPRVKDQAREEKLVLMLDGLDDPCALLFFCIRV